MDGFLGESVLRDVVDLFVRLVELSGASIILVGALIALARFLVEVLVRRRHDAFLTVRLGLGRYLVLGLEFQLAADILRTAIAPTFTEIGQLAAVAAIRTVLNHVLRKEIAEERAELDAGRRAGPRPGAA